jgi:hypothetical protein
MQIKSKQEPVAQSSEQEAGRRGMSVRGLEEPKRQKHGSKVIP